MDTAPSLPHGSLADALQLILAHFLLPPAIWVFPALFQYSTAIPSNLKQIVFKINTKSTQTSCSFCHQRTCRYSVQFPSQLEKSTTLHKMESGYTHGLCSKLWQQMPETTLDSVLRKISVLYCIITVVHVLAHSLWKTENHNIFFF